MRTPKLNLLGPTLCLLILAACSTGLIYQPRPEFTPDGYTDTALGKRQYKIVYETYRKDGEEPYLMEFALRRAGEVAKQNGASYFDVVSKKFDFYQSRVEVPEQIIKNKIPDTPVGMTPDGMTTGGIPGQTYESIIPAHFKEFLVKRVTLVIQLPDQNPAEPATDKPQNSNAIE